MGLGLLNLSTSRRPSRPYESKPWSLRVERMFARFRFIDVDPQSGLGRRVAASALHVERVRDDVVAPGNVRAHDFLNQVIRRGEADMQRTRLY